MFPPCPEGQGLHAVNMMKNFLVELSLRQKATVKVAAESAEDAESIVEGKYFTNDSALAFLPTFEERIEVETIEESM